MDRSGGVTKMWDNKIREGKDRGLLSRRTLEETCHVENLVSISIFICLHQTAGWCGECSISPVHFLEKLSRKSSQGNIARSKQGMKHSIELRNGTHIASGKFKNVQSIISNGMLF